VSRTEIALSEGALLVVGWDPPLATFFAQLFEHGTTAPCRDDDCFIDEPHIRRDCQDDLIRLWVGAVPGRTADAR
jgi:hypothetical protein